MNINVKKISSNIATLAVGVIFSGYFFYHYSLAEFGVPRFLSGYFSPLAVLFGIIIISIQLFRPSLILNKNEIWFYLIFIYMTTLSIIYLIFGNEVQSNREYAYSIFQSLAAFFGTYIVLRNANLGSVVLKRFVGVLFIIQLILIITKSLSNGYFALTEKVDFDLKIAGYQQVALVMLFQAGILMASTSGLKRLAIYLATTIALFYIGARSEFIAFLVCGAVLISINLKRHVAAGYLLFAIILMIMFYQYLDMSESSARTLSIVDIKNQSSYLARKDLTGYALSCIRESPVLGCYGSEYLLGDGAYSHNLISAWQAYGLFLFVGLAYVLIMNLRESLSYISSNNAVTYLAIYYSVMAVFMALFSKYFLDSVFPISFGILASMRIAGPLKERVNFIKSAKH